MGSRTMTPIFLLINSKTERTAASKALREIKYLYPHTQVDARLAIGFRERMESRQSSLC